MTKKIKQPRKPRAYKVTDKDYNAAMKLAARRKDKLAQLIEQMVIAYSKRDVAFYFPTNKPK